jgi:drug/metabolite transporter (DMT)-like permease
MTDSTSSRAPAHPPFATPSASAPASAPSVRPHVFTGPVVLALATVYLVWGSTYFAIRLTLVSFPPFLQGGMRFLIAGTLLFTFLALRGKPMPTLVQWRDGAIIGVLLLTCGNGGVVFAEQYVSSSVAAIFIGAGPLAAALWSGMFGFWPQRMQWAGILLGFAGILMLAGGAQLAGHPIGLAGLVIAVLCWTLGSVLTQRRLSIAPGAMGFATEMLAGGIAMLAIGLARGEGARFVEAWPPTPVATAAMVYLVFAGSLAAFSAYMYLLSQVSSTIAISYAYVNPMIAVLLGVVFGGETLSLREGIATAIIVGSVILLTREKRT